MRPTIAFLICALPAAGPASAEQLRLVCFGGGAANKATVTTGYITISDGQSASGNVYGSRSVGFEDQVDIEIDGASGRIRVPRAMLPAFRGGKLGWFELKNVTVSELEVTGSAAINFINSPKVRIDRRTGQLNISGKAGDFSGECRPVDPNAQKKF